MPISPVTPVATTGKCTVDWHLPGVQLHKWVSNNGLNLMTFDWHAYSYSCLLIKGRSWAERPPMNHLIHITCGRIVDSWLTKGVWRKEPCKYLTSFNCYDVIPTARTRRWRQFRMMHVNILRLHVFGAVTLTEMLSTAKSAKTSRRQPR